MRPQRGEERRHPNRAGLGLVVLVLLAFGAFAAPAGATHIPDQSFKADEMFTSPNQATNSDLAFVEDPYPPRAP
jgi:hypothetical protein